MATARSEEALCSIKIDRVLKLETKDNPFPIYNGIVLMEDKLLVIDDDAWNLQMYNRHDGKLISTSYILGSRPMGICLIGKTEVGVCLLDGILVILSLTSLDDEKLAKTLSLRTEFRECHSVANLNSEKLLVGGRKYTDEDALCWGIVSIKDGGFDSVCDICKGGIGRIHTAIKQNIIYVSCMTSYSNTNGVYAYDIFNPHRLKFMYQHHQLKQPWSIMADKDYLYVTELDSKIIHQLNDSGYLVNIHNVRLRLNEIFYDDQYGVLYTTSYGSNDITEYKIDYLTQTGIPVEILNMEDRAIQLFIDALQDGWETTYNIRIMVVGPFNVGKSTLVRRLLGDNVNISDRCSTEGINICVNFCDVSSLTKEWAKQERVSEQDYTLRRLVKLLNENYQTSIRAVVQDSIPPQQEKTDQNPFVVADFDKNKQMSFQRSQQNIVQNNSSTANIQKETTTDVQRTDSQLDVSMKTRRKFGESLTSESHKEDPLRQLLKVLKENKYKAMKDVGKYARVSIWDFAGQYAFYTTHQMFLTRRAIYLMVADVSGQFIDIVEDDCDLDTKEKMKCKVVELMDIWMNSIHSCAPPGTDNLNASSSTSSYTVIPPPVILVGTHVDQIKQPDRYQRGLKYLLEIRSYLRGKPVIAHLVDEDFALDNSIVDSRLEDLKRKIIDVASQQPYWGERIPTRWFLLEHQLTSLRNAGMKVIARSTVEQLNKEGSIQIKDSEELDLFLKYLHEIGTIIYFSIEVLRENIILVPELLIDALKTLINAHPVLSAIQANTANWCNFKEKGILSTAIVDAVWTQDKYPDLYAHREHLLMLMEQFNIIARPMSFDENWGKMENVYIVPCMLRQECPTEVTSVVQNFRTVSTVDLCYVFKGKYLPPPIFHRLIAACIAHWPVAKRKETSENLIFCGCCVFDIDLFHRLKLYFRSYVIYARITRPVIDDVSTLDARLCTRVKRFITENLSKIISYLGQNLQYELRTQFPPSESVSEHGKQFLPTLVDMWFTEEGPDSDVQITNKHMNYARLCIALATVCGKAMREILRTQVPANYSNIFEAIYANKDKFTRAKGKPLLNNDQTQLLFPQGQITVSLDQFDISLLYLLIRNVSSVQTPSTGWGRDPQDHPQRDTSLGASVERIRSYRNHINKNYPDGKITSQDFQDYWKKFEDVLHDIETVLGGPAFTNELEKQRKHVYSIYEAC